MTGLDAVVLAVCVFVFVAVGLVAARGVRTAEDWLVAGRSLGLGTLVGTLVMTELNTATMLAFSSQAYVVGPWALTLPLVFVVGLGLYTVLVARRYRRLGATSVSELYGARYGRGLQALASGCFLVAMLGFVATYVRSAGIVLAPVVEAFAGAPISAWATSGALVAVVVAITLGGGLVAVAVTDTAAFALTLVGLPALAVAGVMAVGGPDGLSQALSALPPGPSVLPVRFVVSLVVLTSFTYIASPWYGQRMFAARDERTAFVGVGISAVLVGGLYLAASVVAMAVRAERPDLVDPQTALPLSLLLWAPAGLRGLGFALLLAVAVTTMSSIYNTWVAMALTELGGPTLWSSRALTVALGLGSWLIANLLVDDILDNMILANIPIAALAFGLLGGLFWGRASRAGAWSSVVAGVTGALACWWWLPLYTWWWAIAAIPASFAVGIVASLIWPDPPERAAAFHQRVGPPMWR